MSNNRFNFFLPFEINKAKSDGNGKVWISGVCSSKVADTDDEVLDPVGFDFQPLLKSGFFNYNHQGNKTAKAIVGEPTFAEVRNDGNDFYVEGFLYGDSEEAQNIVKLADTLQKNNSSRKLGFSIEGQATERDVFNPKKINKAKITGIAITASPKNPNTLLSIMKGEYAEPFVDIDDEIEEVSKAEEIDIEKGGPGSGRHKTNDIIDSQFNHSLSKNSKGDHTYTVKHKNDKDVRAKFTAKTGEDKEDFLNRITDEVKMFKKQASNDKVKKSEDNDLLDIESLTKEYKEWCDNDSHYGQEDNVKEFLENNHEDNMDVLHDLMQSVNKAITAEGSVITVEDVDGGKDVIDELLKEKKMLKKSEVYNRIIDEYPTANVDQISNIYKLIEKVNNNIMKSEDVNTEILEDAITKSFDILNDTIVKSKDSEEIDEEVEEKDASEDDDKESVEDDKVEKSEETDIEKSDEVGGIVENVEEEINNAAENGLELDFFKSMAQSCISKGLTQEEAVADLQKRGLSLEAAQNAVASVIAEAQSGEEQGDKDTGTPQEVPSVVSGEALSVHSGIKKSEEVDELEKSFSESFENISKSFNNINEKFSTIEKSFADQLTAITSQVSEFIDVHKSIVSEKEALDQEVTSLKEEKEKLEKSLANISQRLENIEQTPQPRKTVTKAVERFEKGESDKTVYELGNGVHKHDVLEMAFNKANNFRLSGRTDSRLEKAIQNIELGFFDKEDVNYLNSSFSSENILIVS